MPDKQLELFDSPQSSNPELHPELLLHPNIPKPLHGINPRTVKGKSWWDRTRKAAYAAHGQCCWACGVHKSRARYHQWLEGHEIYSFDYETGTIIVEGICALCHACHNYIHDGRMQMLVAQDKCSTNKYHEIIVHGEKTLRAAGYDHTKPTYPDFGVPWGQWCMVIEGVRYYSCFSGISEWYEHYVTNKGNGTLTPRLAPFDTIDDEYVPIPQSRPVVAPMPSQARPKRDLSDPKVLTRALEEKKRGRAPATKGTLRIHGPFRNDAQGQARMMNWLDDMRYKHHDGFDIDPDDFGDRW